MSDEQFTEYPGSLLACERAVIRKDLRVGLILGANGGPYPFPSGGGVKIYTAYGPTVNTPLVLDATNVLASLAFDGIANPIVAVGQRVALHAIVTVEWAANGAAVQPFQVESMLHKDGTDITNGTRLMWVISQDPRPDNGLGGQFGSLNQSLMGEFDGDGLPHTARLYTVPNANCLTAEINPSACPNVALRATVFTP